MMIGTRNFTEEHVVSDFIELFREGLSLVYGRPGSGKTSLMLYIFGSVLRWRTLWVSLYETRDQIARETATLGLSADNVDVVDLVAVSPREALMDIIIDRAHGYDALVIDGVNALGSHREISSVLHRMARNVPITVIGERDLKESPLAYVADNIIEVIHVLKGSGQYRYIRVLKSRGRSPTVPVLGLIIGRSVILVSPKVRHMSDEVLSLDVDRVRFPRGAEDFVSLLASSMPWIRGVGISKGSRVAVEFSDVGALKPMILLGDAFHGRKLVVTEYVDALEAICNGCFDVARIDPALLKYEANLSELLRGVRNYDLVVVTGAERLDEERAGWIMDSISSVNWDSSLCLTYWNDRSVPEEIFDWIVRVEPEVLEVVKAPLPLPWRQIRLSTTNNEVVLSYD